MSENIPAGWKLVPIDATEAMEAAAVSRVRPYHDTDWSQHMPKDLFRLAWPALLDAAPQPPLPKLAAEVLMVDMDAPLTAVDRLRALAGGSRDIAFEPSDADEILEKLEALAAILSAPNLEICDAPAPAELSVALEKAAEALKPLADAVFNDNGDMTVSAPLLSAEECVQAYFAVKRIRAALSASEVGG